MAELSSSSARQASATTVTELGEGCLGESYNTTNTTNNYNNILDADSDDVCYKLSDPVESDSFGDSLPGKDKGVLRLGSHNINTYPASDLSTMGGAKMQNFKNILLAGEFDAMAIQEWNKFWPEVPTEDRPRERMKRWTKNIHINLAYNKECKKRKGQVLHGGTGIVSIDDAACRIKGTGRDSLGLGRWCYTRYQGKGGRATRFYSAYRPCKSDSFKGGLTVYQQHLDIMLDANDLRCPRVAFLEDFQTELENAIELGDHVVVGADLNTNLASLSNSQSEMSSFIRGLNLSEAILSRHSSVPPPTFLSGSTVIDSILVSKGIDVLGSGYLDSEAAIGDHRILWVDISYNSALGHLDPFIPTMSARRLTLVDPGTVNSFNKILKKELKDNNIHVLAEHEGRPYKMVSHSWTSHEVCHIPSDGYCLPQR